MNSWVSLTEFKYMDSNLDEIDFYCCLCLTYARLLRCLNWFPNVLGLFHTTLFGVRIHFFQYLVFLAAIIYGPIGGAIAGSFGSLFTAIALNNPYILVGNIILGFLVGYLFKKGFNILTAVLVAYSIQLPWLIITDIYLAGMSTIIVKGVVIGLLISNIAFALITMATWKRIKEAVV